MVKYQEEFEGYLNSNKLKGNESVGEIIKALNAVSKLMGVNISSKNIGSDEDITEVLKMLTQKGKSHDKAMRQYKAAMQYYVNMMNGL